MAILHGLGNRLGVIDSPQGLADVRYALDELAGRDN
jgi:hypothetical protein